MLRTIMAYVLSFATIGLASVVIAIPYLSLVARFRRKTPNVFFFDILATIFMWVETAAVLFASAAIFKFFGKEFGWLPVTLLSAAIIANDMNRIRTRGTTLEIANMLGDSLAIASSCSIIFGLAPLWMPIVAFGLLIALFCYMCLVIILAKSFPFWDRVGEIPDQAYDWFCSQEEWTVIIDKKNAVEKCELCNLLGPFFLYVPKIESWARLYCDADLLDESQAKFLDNFAKAGSDRLVQYGTQADRSK